MEDVRCVLHIDIRWDDTFITITSSFQCDPLEMKLTVPLTPIYLPAKYNESESDVPDLETLEYLIQLPIPKETLLNYELWTLQKLGWKLNGKKCVLKLKCV